MCGEEERERESENLGLGISQRFMLVCCHLAMYELICPCMQVQLVACACARYPFRVKIVPVGQRHSPVNALQPQPVTTVNQRGIRLTPCNTQ